MKTTTPNARDSRSSVPSSRPASLGMRTCSFMARDLRDEGPLQEAGPTGSRGCRYRVHTGPRLAVSPRRGARHPMWHRPKSRLRSRGHQAAQPTSYIPIGSLELMVVAAVLLAIAILLLAR